MNAGEVEMMKESVSELIGLLASYGEYVEVEVAIQHVRDLLA